MLQPKKKTKKVRNLSVEMEDARDIVTPTRAICRDPISLFHPVRYHPAKVIDRIHELVSATFVLQCRHKAFELQHAPECHETAMCVLGYDHPVARIMEDDADPVVRQKTIELLSSSISSLPRTSSNWMQALAMLTCETGKPREFASLVEALEHSLVIQTERGTVWMLWLCALSCLVFPLDESHPLTRPLVDSVICTLLGKTPPTSTHSSIQECVLTICFLAMDGNLGGTLRLWKEQDSPHDRDLRLRALVDHVSDNVALGKSNCLKRNNRITRRHSHRIGVVSSLEGCTDQCR